MGRQGSGKVVLVLISALAACKGGRAEPSETRALRSAPSGVVIDLGAEEDPPELVTGFHASEAIERRRGRWSDGASSEVRFKLKGEAKRHVLALLAEPYFAIQPISVQATINGKPLGTLSLKEGWNGYGVLIEPGTITVGDNVLVLGYSKTGSPSSIDTTSTDTREIGVRFDELQVQPVIESVRFVFDMHDALVRAALGEGWAIDASDPRPGIWTQGERSTLTIYLEPREAKAYKLELTAHGQGGVTAQAALLELNQTPIGQLTFSQGKATQRLSVPTALVRDRNELVFRFQDPKSPAEIDPKSQDKRLLGLRVLKLELLAD